MSDAAPNPSPAPVPTGNGGVGFLRAALLPVGLLAIAGAAFGVVYLQNPPPPPVDTPAALKAYLAEQGKYAKLAADYSDASGDLVADAPTDPTKLLKPDEITFSVVATDDPEKSEQIWKPFLEHLQKTTGAKKVTYLKEWSPPPAEAGAAPLPGTIEQQLDALKTGKLHVTAFNTGFVPAAVNTAGFVPLFCPADANGKYTYEMEIIVPANSPAQTAADLRHKTLAFVAMSSNSGAKAPLVALKEQFNMLPGRDYEFVVSGTHDRSIDGVAAGKYAAAPVADDMLERRVESGKVKATDFRGIYKSSPFPPITFGVAYNLDPKLRADIEKAFETFSFAGNSIGENYAAQKRVKFIRVDYKKDFGYVRDIDEKLAKLLDAK